MVPEAGEGEGLSGAEGDGPGLFGFGVELLPLIEAVGGDEAAAAEKRLAPDGLFHEAFGFGVDGAEAELLRVGAPIRDEAPAHEGEGAGAGVAVLDDDGLLGGGGDVVVGEDIEGGRDPDFEGVGDALFVGAAIVAATHKVQG